MPRSNKKIAALAAIAATALAGAAAAAGRAGADESATTRAAQAAIHDAHGNFLGTVRFLPRSDGKVALRTTAASLPPGFHGFHVHAVGKCNPPFVTAGGHHSPSSTHHGAHAGDLPVLLAAGDGTSRAEFHTDAFTIEELLDTDGSAVIIHAAPDNYANIPTRYSAAGPDSISRATGDAGGRIACGVVEAV